MPQSGSKWVVLRAEIVGVGKFFTDARGWYHVKSASTCGCSNLELKNGEKKFEKVGQRDMETLFYSDCLRFEDTERGHLVDVKGGVLHIRVHL